MVILRRNRHIYIHIIQKLLSTQDISVLSLIIDFNSQKSSCCFHVDGQHMWQMERLSLLMLKKLHPMSRFLVQIPFWDRFKVSVRFVQQKSSIKCTCCFLSAELIECFNSRVSVGSLVLQYWTSFCCHHHHICMLGVSSFFFIYLLSHFRTSYSSCITPSIS